MNKKNIIMWVLCAICWTFGGIGIAVRHINIAWWIMTSLQISCVVVQLIIGVFILIDFRKQEKKFKQELRETALKYLSAEENKEDKEE